MEIKDIPIHKIFWYYIGQVIVCSVFWYLAIDLFYENNFPLEVIYKPIITSIALSLFNVSTIMFIVIHLARENDLKLFELTQMYVVGLICSIHGILIYIGYKCGFNFDLYMGIYAAILTPMILPSFIRYFRNKG